MGLFDLESGLPDDFDGVITDAAYVESDKLRDDDGNPRVALQFTIKPADSELSEQTPFYSVGPGWEVADNGARVVREDDPDDDTKGFNGGTKIGRLLKAIAKLPEAVKIIKDRIIADEPGHGAAPFQELNFHWERQTYDWKMGDTSGTAEILVPTIFLGEGDSKPAKKKAKKAPAKAPAKKASTKKAADPDRDALKTAAKVIFDEIDGEMSSEDQFDEFVTRVVDEVDGAEAHMDYVTDGEGLWADLLDES